MEFIGAAMSQVNKGIYVWGGNGENLLVMPDPEAWIRKKETTAKNAERAISLFRQRVAQGVDPIQAFDCSGLVYWCNKQSGLGYGDKTANGYWKECDLVDELTPGDLVFHHNGIKCTHAGIYVGNGKVVESKGRDDGVVMTAYTKGDWNRKGHLKKMPYVDPTRYVLIVGGSVKVRDQDSTKGKKLGTAHRGEKYTYLGTAPSGWYNIDFNGKNGFISNKPKYTKLI